MYREDIPSCQVCDSIGGYATALIDKVTPSTFVESALSLARAGFKVRSTFRLGAAGWRAAGEEDEVGVDWRFRRYVVRGVLAKTHPFV